MELIDLSQSIFHRTQVKPSHAPVMLTVWRDHAKETGAGDTVSAPKALTYSPRNIPAFGRHRHHTNTAAARSQSARSAGAVPDLRICLDLSHIPLKHAIAVPEMEDALARSGEEIQSGDTVLIYMATNKRLLGDQVTSTTFGTRAGVGALARGPRHRHVRCRGHQSGPEGELNAPARLACAERGITHMECLTNLHKLVGRGRFRFVASRSKSAAPREFNPRDGDIRISQTRVARRTRPAGRSTRHRTSIRHQRSVSRAP